MVYPLLYCAQATDSLFPCTMYMYMFMQATRALLEKEALGLSVAMISKSLAVTPHAMLARSVPRSILSTSSPHAMCSR